jgi:hypothetical protein
MEVVLLLQAIAVAQAAVAETAQALVVVALQLPQVKVITADLRT